MLRKDKEYSPLRQYIEKEYGSLGNATVIWGVKPITLMAGLRNPKNGYKIAESVAARALELQQALAYQQEEYARLARAYNDLADKYNKYQELREERI